MIDFQLGRWMLAAFLGMIVTVGFDAILHGLSESGHGILSGIWEGENSERKSATRFIFGIGWHIIADIALAITLSLIIVFLQQHGIGWAVGIGILIGGIMSTQWVHVYAAFEVGERVVFTLAGLGVIQTILASLVIMLVYWR